MIVSRSEKSLSFFKEMLNSITCESITAVPSGSKARQLLTERSFDLVVINAPLGDESGEELSKHIASGGICQVILVVKTEYYDTVTEIVENYGVMTIAKPVNKNLFWSVLKLAKAVGNNLKTMQNENDKLHKKIEEIRITDRAKCILISCMGMDENEAHKYIEKQAMNLRITKKAAAEGIIKTYENS